MKPASFHWLHESNQVFDEEVAFQKRFEDPETGIPILRLTSQPVINQNIYPEAHISTPDGKRFIFSRQVPLGGKLTFWIADIETLWIRQLTDEENVSPPTVSPDGQWFYYLANGFLKRISASTFEREDCFKLPDKPFIRGGFYTTDPTGQRFIVAARGESGRPGVAIIDLGCQSVQMIYEHPDAINAHPQFSRHPDARVMVQVNNGVELDQDGNLIRLVGEGGASLMVMDPDGSHQQTLRVGCSLLERVQGHQCWVGHDNRAITTLHRRTDIHSPWIQDRIVTIAPSEETYQIVGEGQAFTHIHTDPTGRFWVSDSNQTADIFVGSIDTGRYRLFCHTSASFGGGQDTHPHPFFLGNGQAIGWNSDCTGIPHIYCGRIPEGFLEELL